MDLREFIRNERMNGLTGQQIADRFFEEGVDIRDARDAFYKERYVVDIESLCADVQMLHVSNQPMEPGVGVIIASSEPRALPGVVWRKDFGINIPVRN